MVVLRNPHGMMHQENPTLNPTPVRRSPRFRRIKVEKPLDRASTFGAVPVKNGFLHVEDAKDDSHLRRSSAPDLQIPVSPPIKKPLSPPPNVGPVKLESKRFRPTTRSIYTIKSETDYLKKSAAVATERKPYKKAASPLGASKLRPWDRPMGSKYLCTFVVGIPENADFGVSRRIIGRGGENMRFISGMCRSLCDGEKGTVAKIRLRGHGSGFHEIDTQREADVPLQINISTSSRGAYKVAKTEVEFLLTSVYAEYYRMFGIQYRVKLYEHPQNPL